MSPALRPIERFLGRHEASGGPFALLRLTPETCTDDAVISALDTQLTRLGAHPQRNTPEAEEVVLALHAAAAQLLDPGVRAHLTHRWADSPAPEISPPEPPQPPILIERPSPRPTPATTERSPPSTAALSPLSPPGASKSREHLLLEQDVLRTLGLFGGWNDKAVRHLTALAHARGLTAADAADALLNLSRRGRPAAHAAASPPGPTAPPALPPPHADPHQDLIESSAKRAQAATRLTVFMLLGAIGLVCLGGVGLVVLSTMVTSKDGSPTPSSPVSDQPVAPPGDALLRKKADPADQPTGTAGGQETVEKRPPRQPSEPITADLVRSRMTEAGRLLKEDPEASFERFRTIIDDMAHGWQTLTPDARIAAHQAIIEFMHQTTPRHGASDAAAEMIIAHLDPMRRSEPMDAQDVSPSAWAVGVLSRLAREQEFPALVRNTIASALTETLGQDRSVESVSFSAGAEAALTAMIPHLALDAWPAWEGVVRDVSADNTASHDRHVLLGLESLLTTGQDPTQNRAVFDAVRSLTTSLDWSDSGEARRWLVRWLTDHRFTADDLHALTSTLYTEARAPGVDVTMVLPVRASMQNRLTLRDRYANGWNMAARVQQHDLTTAWAKELAAAGRDAGRARGSADTLASAVRLARLSEIASLIYQGRDDEADQLLRIIDVGLSPSATRATSALMTREAGDWAARYLALRRNVPVRIDLLEEARRTSIGPIAGDIIAAEALRGSPAEVRRRAGETALAHRSSPELLSGMIASLPMTAPTRDVTALIETITSTPLPPPSSEAWPIAARRALVERLLDQVASRGKWAEIERLSELLSFAYAGMLGGPTSGLEADVAAGLLWHRWRETLANVPAQAAGERFPLTLAEIERRRAGRLRLADGLAQAFAAQQVSLCEMMGIVIASEKPAHAPQITAIIEDLADDRRGAQSVLDQIERTELAICRLWMIRLGADNEQGENI